MEEISERDVISKQTYISNVFIFSFVSYSATLSKRDQLYDNFRVTILRNKT